MYVMNIVLWAKGARGASCLSVLHQEGIALSAVVAHPASEANTEVADLAAKQGIVVLSPEDPNTPAFREKLDTYRPDLFILAGYGKIIKQHIIDVPGIMCINLHGGKLPWYRGSSPLNWALINGEKSFTLSIIKVNAGVDTGDILLERTFPISTTDTIRDLHAIANEQFPLMLLEALRQIEKGTYRLTQQDPSQGSYYPLRFPDDGLILWDMYTAEQVHNRVRALTEPYPCAFTFFKDLKIKLVASELHDFDYFGEPGRVYMKSGRGLLICALDKCLWIREATVEKSGKPLFDLIKRYDRLATLREAAAQSYSRKSS
jgi:methionyl-tRNA formyltransferase